MDELRIRTRAFGRCVSLCVKYIFECLSGIVQDAAPQAINNLLRHSCGASDMHPKCVVSSVERAFLWWSESRSEATTSPRVVGELLCAQLERSGPYCNTCCRHVLLCPFVAHCRCHVRVLIICQCDSHAVVNIQQKTLDDKTTTLQYAFFYIPDTKHNHVNAVVRNVFACS